MVGAVAGSMSGALGMDRTRKGSEGVDKEEEEELDWCFQTDDTLQMTRQEKQLQKQDKMIGGRPAKKKRGAKK